MGKIRIKLLHKTIIAIIGTLVPILIVWIFFVQGYFHNELLKEASERLSASRVTKSKEISKYFGDLVELFTQETKNDVYFGTISLLSRPDKMYTSEEEKILVVARQNLEHLSSALRYIHHLILTDSQGKILMITDDHPDEPEMRHLGKDIDATFGIRIFDNISKAKSISDIFVEKREGYPNKYRMIIGAPLIREGELHGTIAMEFHMDMIYGILSTTAGIGESGDTYLVGSDKILRSPSRFGGEDGIMERVIDTKNTSHCFSGQLFGDKENVFQNHRGIEVLGQYSYIPLLNWCLLAEINTDEIFAPSKNLFAKMMRGAAVTSFIFLIVAFLLSYKILRPLQELTIQVKKFGEGDLKARAENNASDEVGELAAVFNQMAKSLQGAREEIEKKVEEQTIEIRNQKEHAEEISLERLKFQLAVEKASEHIVILDKDLRILYANDAVEKITGYNKDKIIGHTIGEFWGAEEDFQKTKKMWEDIQKKKKPYRAELKNYKKDGSQYIVEAHISPVLTKNKEEIHFFVMIEVDITNRKKVENMKNDFIDIVSHELRTPMTLIKGYASMILEDFGKDIPKMAKKQLEIILRNTDRLIFMVNDMLDVSRIESGNMELFEKKEQIALKSLIKDIKSDFMLMARKKNIRFEVYLEDDNYQTYYNVSALKRVFTNIIGNSFKFVKAGEGIIKISINKNKTGLLQVDITNNGSSINMSDSKKIFEKFGMVESSINHTTSSGTGLGLTICKSIIEHNNGHIWLNALQPKNGTTFSFTIPHIKV